MNSQSYRDADVLEELYHKKRLTQIEIADKFGVCQTTIYKWMKKNDLETRKSNREKPPCYRKDSQGYKSWRHNDGKKQQEVFIHRLLAVSEFGFDAVSDKVVHHKNGCKIDNRPNNIEVMTNSEHMKLHNQEDWQEVEI